MDKLLAVIDFFKMICVFSEYFQEVIDVFFVWVLDSFINDRINGVITILVKQNVLENI